MKTCKDCITYTICRSTVLTYIEKYRELYIKDDIISFHYMLHNVYYNLIFKKCNKIDKEITKLKPNASLPDEAAIILNCLSLEKEVYEYL